jgi:hypothetical protein
VVEYSIVLGIKRRAAEADQTVADDLGAWTTQTFAYRKRHLDLKAIGQLLLVVMMIVAGALIGMHAVLPESSRESGSTTREPTLGAASQGAAETSVPVLKSSYSAPKEADDLQSQLAQATEKLKSSQVAPVAGPTAVPLAPARPPTEKSASGVDIPLMLARGDSLRRVGDIASARLFYERAANAGDGQAALRLGESYDPAFLERAQLRVPGDRALAVFWYQRARELGESKAEILLKGAQVR